MLIVDQLKIKHQASGRELLRGVSFQAARCQCLGLVGESGSGKSLTCRAMMGLVEPGLEVSGQVFLDGLDIQGLEAEERRRLRGRRLGMIIQEAMSAFNPLLPVGRQMRETLMYHRRLSRAEAGECSRRALSRMLLADPEAVMSKYPHQLSGGMLQRVMIALTLALEPEVIIADEPTTALDPLTRHEIVDHFLRLKKMRAATLIFVSHDLAVVRRLADRVAVMYEGRVVEEGPAEEVFVRPAHGYTKMLIQAHQTLGRGLRRILGSSEAA